MSRPDKLLLASMLMLGALLYAPHLPAPFVADDHFIFWRLREGGMFGFATRPPTGFYRPLISLHYYLDYALWGIQPFWSHLVDVGWHLLCAWLVAQFGWIWQRDSGKSPQQAARTALLTMAFFLVLPAHGEAVAWFAARADMVATAAALACLLLLRASVRTGRTVYEGLALLCFAAGLLAKESLLSFPWIVWLWLRWLGAAHAGWRTMPYWIVLGIFWWLRSQVVGGLGAYPAAWEVLRQPWWLSVHLMVYLFQLPMPTILFGLGRDGLDTLLWLGWAAGGLLLAWGLRGSADPSAPQRNASVFLPGFALIALLPVLLFKPSPWHFLNSRYSYLASAWLTVWLASIVVSRWEQARAVRWGVLVLVLAYAAGTARQATAWAVAGTIVRSTLQSLQNLPTDRPVMLIGVPDHYRGAYIWRAGLYEAIGLLLPERNRLPVYALSRFTMRLKQNTEVIYTAGEARLTSAEDIFLPPEGLVLPPDSAGRWHIQPHRVWINPDWAQGYLLLRYQDGRFIPAR
ncbi:hypothetical protein HRbin15_02123 [bacterium HR15]|nr:hypothetical protein HRbin15_02123 [bacterium HR15]